MKHSFANSLRRLSILGVVALSAAACVSPGPTRTASLCGQEVTFHPDNVKPCNGGASACTVRTAGQSGYHVYYSTFDEAVLGHEEEHVCGMRHREPWVSVGGKSCTVVTEGGNTQWKKGDVMCRVDSGPIVKMNDPRVRSFTMNAN